MGEEVLIEDSPGPPRFKSSMINATLGEARTTSRKKKLSCKSVFLPLVVTALVAGLIVVVWVMVDMLLTEKHASAPNFDPNPPHPSDDLAQMRTISPSFRWPVLLLLTTVLVLAVGVAALVWFMSRQPSQHPSPSFCAAASPPPSAYILARRSIIITPRAAFSAAPTRILASSRPRNAPCRQEEVFNASV